MNRSLRSVAGLILLGFSLGANVARAADSSPGIEVAPPPPTDAAAPAPPPPPPAAAPATTPLKIDGATTNIKFGLLIQPQFQSAGSPTLNDTANNMYIRRTRVLIGGTLLGLVDYFFDTDFPNLFLDANTVGAAAPPAFMKTGPGLIIQDAFLTYKALDDVVKVDVGFMLPPMSHNAVQSAASLYSWDYFAYTFQHSNVFGSTVNPSGRDLGVQVRGLVLDGHLEYRGGLFQGFRDNETATQTAARNFFRATGRVQVNLLDPETGFFYGGTYLGTKKIASVGLSGDVQGGGYRYVAIDGIVDLPVGPGVATAQVDLAHWNGGTLVALPKQTAIMGEAGFTLTGLRVSPILRVEHLFIANAGDQNRIGGGVAYWPYGHTSNLKLFYTRLSVGGDPHGANQFNLQWQIYFF